MKIDRLLVSCFGLGWMPIAPGTWGSLPPTIIFALLCYFGISITSISITMVAMVILGSFICVKFSPYSIGFTAKKDPSEVVADEFAGQAVTFIGAYASGEYPIIITAALGFLLFRLFDIIKPWPIRNLEKLPAGWGILADDLLAGVFAAVVLQICIKFWIAGLA